MRIEILTTEAARMDQAALRADDDLFDDRSDVVRRTLIQFSGTPPEAIRCPVEPELWCMTLAGLRTCYRIRQRRRRWLGLIPYQTVTIEIMHVLRSSSG